MNNISVIILALFVTISACAPSGDVATTQSGSWYTSAPKTITSDSTISVIGVASAIDSSFAEYQSGAFGMAMLQRSIRTQLEPFIDELPQEERDGQYVLKMNAFVNDAAEQATFINRESISKESIYTSYVQIQIDTRRLLNILEEHFGSDHQVVALAREQWAG